MTKDTRERSIGVELHFDATLDDIMGGWKKQTAANFYKRDLESLAEDEGKSEIEYLKEIENNLSGDEVILVKISNSISQRVGVLLNQIKVIRKGSLKPLNPDSGETAGTKALGPRDGRA